MRDLNRGGCYFTATMTLRAVLPVICLAAFSFTFASTPEGLPGTYAAPSAQTLEHARLSFGATAFGHTDESTIRDGNILFAPGSSPPAPDTNSIQDLVSAGAKFHLALGLGGNFDIGLSLPVYADLLSDPPQAAKLSGVGLGDLKVLAKIKAPLPTPVFAMALAGGLTFPMHPGKGFLPKGSEFASLDTAGRGPNYSTYSANTLTKLMLFLLTLDLTKVEQPIPFRLDVSGGLLNQPFRLGGNRLQWNAGLQWLPTPSLGIFTALNAQATLDSIKGFGSFAKEDMRLTCGLMLNSEDGFFVSGGVQFAVSKRPYYVYQEGVKDGHVAAYKARAIPGMALGLQVGFSGVLISKDTDGDGVVDKIDACPKDKEDLDGFQDADGCPEADNDEDGLTDAHDKCPGQAEDKDGIQDDDGCPEPDADKDGIRDEDDKCPLEPEDRDGFQDMDGCPDLDNDQDGILDSQDKCPMVGEDKDAFQDDDGCPEPDNDKDGFCDSWVDSLNQGSKYVSQCRGIDKCPDAAQSPGGLEGCPAAPGATAPAQAYFPGQFLLSRVRFQGQTSALTSDSYASLDSLADALKANPGVRVEIRVYTDDLAKERAAQLLTQSRAEALRKHLILKGVDRLHVNSRGMGSQSPVASNRTPQGRAQNRRVEVVRTD